MKLKELLPHIDPVEMLRLSRGEYGMTVSDMQRQCIDSDYLESEVGLISEYDHGFWIELEEEE